MARCGSTRSRHQDRPASGPRSPRAGSCGVALASASSAAARSRFACRRAFSSCRWSRWAASVSSLLAAGRCPAGHDHQVALVLTARGLLTPPDLFRVATAPHAAASRVLLAPRWATEQVAKNEGHCPSLLGGTKSFRGAPPEAASSRQPSVAELDRVGGTSAVIRCISRYLAIEWSTPGSAVGGARHRHGCELVKALRAGRRPTAGASAPPARLRLSVGALDQPRGRSVLARC